MFDIGFSEILVIMVVALVVIGPERLPKVARSMGQWWGRIQRYLNKIKQDVNSSIELEELRETQRKFQAEADEMERSLSSAGSEINHSLSMLEKELENSAQNPDKDVAPPAPSPLPPDRDAMIPEVAVRQSSPRTGAGSPAAGFATVTRRMGEICEVRP